MENGKYADSSVGRCWFDVGIFEDPVDQMEKKAGMILTQGDEAKSITAIFMGVSINKKLDNPYAPSAVKFSFALSDGRRMVSLPASGETAQQVERVLSRSFQLNEEAQANFIEKWDQAISNSSADRETRYIITGNILQATPIYKGKLISYTTADDKVKKGILVPPTWSFKENARHVVVPASQLGKVLRSLSVGQSFSMIKKVSFMRQRGRFNIIIKQHKTYQMIYTDWDLINLMEQSDGFQKVSDKMKASFVDENLDKVLDILSDKYSINAQLDREKYDFEPPEEVPKDDNITAEALKLFDQDKRGFDQRLSAQEKRKKANDKKAKGNLKLARMRAKAILILQAQVL